MPTVTQLKTELKRIPTTTTTMITLAQTATNVLHTFSGYDDINRCVFPLETLYNYLDANSSIYASTAICIRGTLELLLASYANTLDEYDLIINQTKTGILTVLSMIDDCNCVICAEIAQGDPQLAYHIADVTRIRTYLDTTLDSLISQGQYVSLRARFWDSQIVIKI